ncbi:Lar family restriction alleviation protein [Halioxenophilus sp. WMMB6]|uniref:Lar family restriction alleviation protein n=1 Tax=Halioxenophilus sp. WMMB6 TaxID=3073815 RepID=UPI00295E3991|nr:Lar family restriction alleviation protein [Halioxenophilus sp. WMMB6]
MALQIEPCPFCGSEHLHMVVHSLTYSVACQSCRCRGPQRENQELAVMQWNATSRTHARAASTLTPEAVEQKGELVNQRLPGLMAKRESKPAREL